MNKLIFITLFTLIGLNSALSQHKGMYTNPILSGFYPDPSICRVDSDYYLVNSTFAYFPGIPVFHSKDLVNWEHIGDVMNRPKQLNLDSMGVSRGIFAPAIRYNKAIFYVTCTLVDGGGNFVVTAKSPAGPWSNPVWIPQIDGIDPSVFFDEVGKAFIVYNSVAPNNKPLYEGHRTIRMYEFNTNSLKVIGKERILVNGGTDIKKKPVWIEGPHIFKIKGYYYLIAAQGGTGYDHSEVVFKSKNVYGPYVPYKNNPILTQRNLNPEREYPITSTGHADLVQTISGDWWAVFLGCRPYAPFDQDFYNTGRETFLAPVRWVNGWPLITSDNEKVQYYYPYSVIDSNKNIKTKYSGNISFLDNFDSDTLNLDWEFLRTPEEKWYSLKKKKGFLKMDLRPETCSEKVNPSFLGHRQQNLNCSASVSMNFIPENENEKAGLLIFQNESHYYFLCRSLENNKQAIQLYKSTDTNQMELLASKINNADDSSSYLKIEAEGNKYSFSYSINPDSWILLKDSVDGEFLSTKEAGGFVGCMFALYATSLDKETNNKAYFDWFKYFGKDEVYK